jgi:hypothetical protein
MARLDPRLANPTLLALAAQRVLARQEQPPPPPHWSQTEGLSALLAAAKHLPKPEPFSLPAVDECTGLARLLAEARQWQKGGDRGD